MSEKDVEKIEAELVAIRKLITQMGLRVTPVVLTLAETAQMLSCSPRHVGRMVKRGLLRPVDVGGARRIPVSQVHRLITEPVMESSGASPARVKFDGAAALKRLDELTKKKR